MYNGNVIKKNVLSMIMILIIIVKFKAKRTNEKNIKDKMSNQNFFMRLYIMV